MRPSVRSRLDTYSKQVGDCIEWVGYRNKFGYGKIFVGGKAEFSHRAAWADANGQIPQGMFICHKCDNRACIKLSHLFLGTRQDNINDMVAKKRRRGVGGAKGEKHPIHKLTEQDVLAIRVADGKGNDLAALFGVSRSVIYAVRKRITWKHI